ncbi:MAG: ECF transporter S component [Firmicutes bacterium]|nr:ECF transporter S component [Bacillota bacterium]
MWMRSRETTRRLVAMAMLTAMALVLIVWVKVPLFTDYLIYEPGDVPVLIAGFLFGPAAGIAMAAVVAVVMALITGLGGPFGAFMHFLATGALVGVSSAIYWRWRTLGGAIASLLVATLATTGLMAWANLLLSPVFYGIPREVVQATLWPAIIPFNLVKASLNSVVTFALYKQTAVWLRRYMGVAGAEASRAVRPGGAAHLPKGGEH